MVCAVYWSGRRLTRVVAAKYGHTCTANGVSLVKVTFDGVASDQLGDKVHSSATMECPLCWMPMAGAPAQMRLPSPQLDSGLIASATWLQARLSPRYSLPARAPPAI